MQIQMPWQARTRAYNSDVRTARLKIKLTIRNIPASVCPVCHESYVDRKTARNLDRLIEPFHGKHRHIPALPPADVTIDFAEAVASMKAA